MLLLVTKIQKNDATTSNNRKEHLPKILKSQYGELGKFKLIYTHYMTNPEFHSYAFTSMP